MRDCRGTVDHGFGYHVRVHANDVAAGGYLQGIFPLAEGSVLVKTIHDDTPDCGGEVVARVAMRKGPLETAPEAGGWEWQETDEAHTVLAGDAQKCVSCHTSCSKGRDFTCTDP